MKKKNIFIILGIIIIAITLFFVLFTRQTQIPNICTESSEGTTFGQYTCRSDLSFCSVEIELFCDTQTASKSVILRVSDLDTFPSQVALDSNGDGALEAWKKSNTRSSQNICTSRGTRRLIDGFATGTYFIERSGDVYLCSSSDNIKYKIGGSIPTSTSPISSYSDKEKYGGDVNAYECSQEVSGSISDIIKYSSNSPGSTTQSYILNPGEKIIWNGDIKYREVLERQSECTENQVDENDPQKYYECVVDNSGCGVLDINNPLYCESNKIYDEGLQECKVPYNLELNLNKEVFSLQESISGELLIKDTTSKDNILIELVLKNFEGNIEEVTTKTTDSRGSASFIFNPISEIGRYIIEARVINHPLGELEVSKNFEIVPPLFIRLTPYPDQIQYLPNLIKARAFATDNDGNPREVNSWDFSGSTCGTLNVESNIDVDRIGSTSKDGTIYEFSANIDKSCILNIRAVGIDSSGFRTQAKTVTIDVRASQISIQQINFPVDDEEGRYKLKFRTFDINGQPIETNNNVIIKDRDNCESGKYCVADEKVLESVGVIPTGNLGEYEFSYTFKSGFNSVIITSKAASGILSNTQEFGLTFFPSTSPKVDVDDPTDIIDDEPREFPIGLVIVSLIVLIGIILFLLIVFKKRK